MLAIIAALGAAVLAHLAPFPFLLDTTRHSVWRMPRGDVPTVYLTFDDGPNPAATPLILDALSRHGARATFFVLDRHLTRETAPIVRRAAAEGHAVALHWHSREPMFKGPVYVASLLQEAAARMELLTGVVPCRAFRPHAGHRSIPMLMGASRAGYTVVGWGWMLWDFNWFRERDAGDIAPRLVRHASPGDIVVVHDGHHEDPRADRRYAVDVVERVIPELRAKGLAFGTVC